MKWFVMMLCLAAVPLLAQDPPPPDVKDLPKPAPKVTITVPKGVLGEGKQLSPYVFDSTTKCFLTLSNLPEGTKVARDDWDLEDAPPDAEPISDNTIIALSLANPGKYVTNIHGPYGYHKIWLEIKGSGPSPPVDPPGPGPVIPPGPVVDPPKPPVDPNARVVPPGFRVMFVYETSSKLTSKQSVILGSTRIRKYLDSKCDKATEGQFKGLPEYRFWDKDGKDANKDSPAIKAMWEGIRGNLGKLPAVEVHENGKAHYHVLPDDATEDSVLTMLQSYGGK